MRIPWRDTLTDRAICMNRSQTRLELYPYDNDNSTYNNDRTYEFVRIRYQTSSYDDESIFRQAFKQVKPGGWLEVVEDISPDQHPLDRAVPIEDLQKVPVQHTPTSTSPTPSQCHASRISQYLLRVGFVDVEKKVWDVSGDPQPRMTGITGLLKNICTIVFGLPLKCPITQGQPTEKPSTKQSTQTVSTSPSFFVIGRKPYNV